MELGLIGFLLGSAAVSWLRSQPGELKEEEIKEDKSLVEVDPPCDVDNDCECKFGFKREGFKSGEITAKIPYHKKHIFLSSGQKYTEWPEKIEDVKGSLAKFLTDHYKKKNEKIRISCIEDASSKGTDVYIFPDMIKYINVTEEHYEGLADAIASNSRYSKCESFKIKGTWIFVCCHQARDKRCGTCGPRIYLEFKEKLKNKEIPNHQSPIHLKRCSHCAAHTYAGNVIIYKFNDLKDQYYGDIFGYVNLQDVDRLLDEYVIKGHIPLDLWCGRSNCEQTTQKVMVKWLPKK